MAAIKSFSIAAVSSLSSGTIWQMIVMRATLKLNLYNKSTMLSPKCRAISLFQKSHVEPFGCGAIPKIGGRGNESNHGILNYTIPPTVHKIPTSHPFAGSENWGLIKSNKKLSYRRGTARCVVSVKILPNATQQWRNYLYDKSWTKYQLSLIDLCNKIMLQTALDNLCNKL